MISYEITTEELSKDSLEKLLLLHTQEATKLGELFKYYEGKHIADKGERAEGRPNNIANTNLAKYISDVATGYFVGVPPAYSFDNDTFGIVQDIFDQNDETDVNFKIALYMSIAGRAYDIVWIDEDSNIRITPLKPQNAFLVRSADLAHKVLYGVYRYAINDGESVTEYVDVYSPTEKVSYKRSGAGGNLYEISREEHYIGDVPITEYLNNTFGLGDFEAVTADIDQYNVTLSNASDDLQSIANAYLALCGMMGTEKEDIDEANKTRVLKLEEGGQAYFITKNISAEAIESHKRTLRQDILQVAGVPNLSDEAFAGNSSGVALEFKMWGLDQLFVAKKQGMDSGLFRRLKLIANILTLKGAALPDIASNTSIIYTRNMPRDNSTAVDNAVKLNGVVSSETVYQLVEPVTGVSPKDELERMGEYSNLGLIEGLTEGLTENG